MNAPQCGGVIASMRRRTAAVCLLYVSLALLGSTPSWAGVEVDGAVIDPGQEVRPALLMQALAAWRTHPEARRDRIAVADFAAASTAPRLFFIDLKTGAVERHRTAHGRGSDRAHEGWAKTFSNAPGSNASALGAYIVGAPYVGAHGLSLYLDGLDETNSNARSRAIVLHSAPYMTAEFIARFGRPGRSLGCFVVAPNEMAHVAEWLEQGVLLYAGN